MTAKALLDSLEAARVFDLEQLRYAGAPSHPAHAPGFSYFLHRHHARGAGEARTGASGIVLMPEHSGTHIDALAHQAENLTLHGGIHVDDGDQKEPAVVMDAVVSQALPNAMFEVEVEGGHKLIAYAAGRMRRYFIRITPGDRIRVELSPYDLSRGRIVYRYRD